MLPSVKHLFLVIPLMALLTFTNTFIGFVCGSFVDMQLEYRGVNKFVALFCSVLTVCGVYVFMIGNHRIRNLIGSLDR